MIISLLNLHGNSFKLNNTKHYITMQSIIISELRPTKHVILINNICISAYSIKLKFNIPNTYAHTYYM